MPISALSRTWKTSDSSAEGRSLLVREALAVFGEVYHENVSKTLGPIWERALADLSTDQLERAFDGVLKSCRRRFPTIADVRMQIDQLMRSGLALKAEEAWHELMEWVRRYVFPDTGICRDAPRLDPVMEHAARAAGSLSWLERCSEEDLIWAKKRFVDDYIRIHETRQAEHLIADGDTKSILAKLAAGARKPQPKRLAPPQGVDSAEPSPREVRAVSNEVTKPKAEAHLTGTDQELERWKLEQKERQQEFLKTLPKKLSELTEPGHECSRYNTGREPLTGTTSITEPSLSEG